MSLAAIASFQPSEAHDNWRELDELVQGIQADLAAVPTLLRVFERFPRHDGHGVFWTMLHVIESVPGYEAVLVEHVMRTPTEMGVTMLQRLVNKGTTHVGVHELAPLIVMLSARAPIIDYTIESTRLASLLAALDAFAPAERWDTDWSPLRRIVDELVATAEPAIVTPLLRTLDRFQTRDAFSPYWAIVNGLEQLPGWPAALVTSMQRTPTKSGATLLLRLIATGVLEVDGVNVGALAAKHM